MKIKLSHIRAIGMCRKGAQAAAKTYGIDWQKLQTEGVEASEILATGDHRAEQLIESVKLWAAVQNQS